MSDSSTSRHAIRGRVLLLAAALLWSTSGLFVKSPPLQRLPEENQGLILAFYRALFASVFLIPFVRRRHMRWRASLVPMAAIFALMNVLFLTAMTKTTAAAAIFLQYTSIVWAFVLGVLFLRERIDRGSLVALMCAVGGIVVIVTLDRAGQHAHGNVIALGSGLSYGCVIIFLRYLRHEHAMWLIALNHCVTTLVLIPWILPVTVTLEPIQWCLLASMGLLQMAVPYTLFAYAVRYVKAQEAALIPLIEPILNPVWVWLLWREQVHWSTWIGGGLIVGGLLFRYLASQGPGPIRATARLQ